MRTRTRIIGVSAALLLMAGCSSSTTESNPTSSAPPARTTTPTASVPPTSTIPSTATPSSTVVPSSTSASDDPAVPVGTSVLANHEGDKWYPATILTVKEGLYEVQYDRKVASDEKLPATKVAKLPTGARNVKTGDKLVARWTPETWWNATVKSVADQKVAVLYSDNTEGSVTTSDLTSPLKGTVVALDLPSSVPANTMPPSTITPASSITPPSSAAASGSKEPVATKEEPFPVGMTILGNWMSGQAWYPGKITAAKGGLYDVAYNDGSKESDLTVEKLAYFPGGPQNVKVGDTVIAEWRPSTWWSATVTGVNGEMVSITYSDSTTGTLKNTQFTRAGPQK